MTRPTLLLIYSLGLLYSFSIVFTANAGESLHVHGFVAQGIINAKNSNFINDDESISFELTEIGINASYKLSSHFRVAGQMVYLNGGNRYQEGTRLDYLLLEWNAFENEAWRVSFYAGRVKNNHWLYSDTRDIPFARPSIILPQGTYFDGFRDLAVGGDGAAMKINYSGDGLGEIDFNFSRGKSAISDDQADVILGESALGKLDHDLDAQASIYWRPAFSQWQFGLSANDATFSYNQAENDNFFNTDFSFQFYTANARYEGEFWQLSAEILQSRFVTDGFYFPGFHRDEIGQGYYLQARYQLNEDLALISRTENFYNNKDDKNGTKLAQNSFGLIPAYFGYHQDNMLGLSYNFTSNFRVNAEYHWMEGAARLSPVVQPNPIANNSKNWQVWAIQFVYWL